MDAPAYKQLIDELFHLICEYGINLVGRPEADGPTFYEFQVAVHDGWKKAQLKIHDSFAVVEQEILSNESTYKVARLARDKPKQQAAIENRKVLAYQRNGLLFAQNAIIWTIFGFKTWIVRRFFLDLDIKNASPDSLERAFRYIAEVNKQDNRLVVACDLTTFMHVGDVVQVEIAPDGSQKVTIIELKEGEKNNELMSFLVGLEEIPCPRAAAFRISELPKKDQGQIFRLLKQHWRMENVAKAVNEGRAKDISSGHELRIPDKEYIIDSYESQIVTLYSKIEAGASWAIDVVENCVFVGLYKPPQMSFAFGAWLEILDFSGLRVDFATQGNSPLARPILTLQWPKELIVGLLKREIVLFVALDVQKWIESVNKRWPGFLKSETRRKSKQFSYKKGELLEHDHRLILGGLGDKQGYVGSGILAKILFEFYSPSGVFVPWQDDLDNSSGSS